MEIRTAGDADVDVVAELIHALFRTDAGSRDPFTDVEAAGKDAPRYFAGFLQESSTVSLLAVEDGVVAGYLLGRFTEKLLIRKVSSAELVSLFVREEFRDQKVGTRLVDSFLRWAKEKGAGRASVSAYFANDSARRFYERAGFTPKSVLLDVAL
jgi:GNAT superfamily N-acetyltransferase